MSASIDVLWNQHRSCLQNTHTHLKLSMITILINTLTKPAQYDLTLEVLVDQVPACVIVHPSMCEVYLLGLGGTMLVCSMRKCSKYVSLCWDDEVNMSQAYWAISAATEGGDQQQGAGGLRTLGYTAKS